MADEPMSEMHGGSRGCLLCELVGKGIIAEIGRDQSTRSQFFALVEFSGTKKRPWCLSQPTMNVRVTFRRERDTLVSAAASSRASCRRTELMSTCGTRGGAGKSVP
jgi:hypothetical protein